MKGYEHLLGKGAGLDVSNYVLICIPNLVHVFILTTSCIL